MRIAAFGDIHGNLFALQAVLADLRTQKPDGLLVTGDLVYKFPWGAEVVDLLRSLPCQVILGNAELYLALWDTSLWPEKWNLPARGELVMWERERLGSERLAWLASLPEHVGLFGPAVGGSGGGAWDARESFRAVSGAPRRGSLALGAERCPRARVVGRA